MLFQALSQHAEVKVEFIIPPDHLLIISAGAGLGLLLLIIITVVMWKVRLRSNMKKTSNYLKSMKKIWCFQFINTFNSSPSWAVSKGKVLTSLRRKSLVRMAPVLFSSRRSSASQRLSISWNVLRRKNPSLMTPRGTSQMTWSSWMSDCCPAEAALCHQNHPVWIKD